MTNNGIENSHLMNLITFLVNFQNIKLNHPGLWPPPASYGKAGSFWSDDSFNNKQSHLIIFLL